MCTFFNRNIASQRMLLILLFAASSYLYGQPPSSGDTQDIPAKSEFINLGTLTPCDCRKPTQFPGDIEEARRLLPCRQMKMVQHFLNLLQDERTYNMKPDLIGDTEPDLNNADKRRQYFFGPYWESIKNSKNRDRELYNEALKKSFARMTAVLIASELPSDRYDGGDRWMWELPDIYSQSSMSLDQRKMLMRSDVNEWIKNSGIWVFSDVGTKEKKNREEFGDYDFILSEIISFMYMFKNRRDLVDDESMKVLLIKNFETSKNNKLIKLWDKKKKAEWIKSNVPFSGQDFEQDLWYKQILIFPETENHILEILSHYYLINQWIENDSRGCQTYIYPPSGKEVTSWFTNSPSQDLYKWARDICSRPMFKGFFEDNARIYQAISLTGLHNFATYATDELIKTEAQNSLHFLASKIAFQSLDGRRSPPIRRNCEEANNMYLYNGDAASVAFHSLAGIYKWNDSPYGFKLLRKEGVSEFESVVRNPNNEICKSVFWHTYTFKTSDPKGEPNNETISGYEDWATNKYYSFGIKSTILYFLFSDYVIPDAIWDFMLHKYDGYYAGMTAQYDKKNYIVTKLKDKGYYDSAFDNFKKRKENRKYYYFYNDVPFDHKTNNERTPEIVFATDYCLNLSGGVFNAFEGQQHKEKKKYKIEFVYSLPGSGGLCTKEKGELKVAKRRVYPYHFLSRPYTIVPNVPKEKQKRGENYIYKPFGPGRSYSYDEAMENMALMPGDIRHWYKSSNIATYKNFSYGYKVERKKDWITYEKIGDSFPMDIPKEWSQSPSNSFNIGKADQFIIYDLREVMQRKGQVGFFLVTARLYKGNNINRPWSKRVARGFWEIVPESRVSSLDELKNLILANNRKENFRIKKSEDYFYKLCVSGETVYLYRKIGFRATESTKKQHQVQGIYKILDSEGGNIPLEKVFINFMNNQQMNRLPLLNVKALDRNFNYITYTHGDYVMYGCARDGWLAINNYRHGTWFFADSRRIGNRQGTSYWMEGKYRDNVDVVNVRESIWKLSCEPGSNQGPPPENIAIITRHSNQVPQPETINSEKCNELKNKLKMLEETMAKLEKERKLISLVPTETNLRRRKVLSLRIESLGREIQETTEMLKACL
ncbi:MAG: hypothetical protein NW241_15485 [Bacteroidia bacterium]|nr:hypothetical protein [Bacteroidia bacterium]